MPVLSSRTPTSDISLSSESDRKPPCAICSMSAVAADFPDSLRIDDDPKNISRMRIHMDISSELGQIGRRMSLAVSRLLWDSLSGGARVQSMPLMEPCRCRKLIWREGLLRHEPTRGSAAGDPQQVNRGRGGDTM